MRWLKSSYTNGGNDPQCVELARPDETRFAVRDSKQAHGPTLTFSARAFDAFLTAAKD